MSDTTPKKADAFIEPENHDLRSIFNRINYLEKINQKVSTFLDAEMAKYCQVANLIGNTLVFIAANGSIATQLRFLSADLLKKFRLDPDLKNIYRIDCKVRPATTQKSTRLSSRQTRNMSSLSPETADIIRAMAASIDDPKLQEVMKRIAERSKK